jgi:DNA polymerase I-like protein with 3'-5' exonuclease and polymerase domains
MLRNFRDRDGSRPYRQLRLAEVELSHRLWWRARQAVAKYHEANRIFWREHGYLADAIDGRWRRFLDGSDNNEGEVKEQMANYPIQSTAAADVNAATQRVAQAYPWSFAGSSTGIIHQCHDALLLEVPELEAEHIGRHVVELMHSTIGDMELPVDLAIGLSWGSLRKIALI